MQWIKTSERLPEHNATVLAWFSAYPLICWYNANESLWYGLMKGKPLIKQDEVSHWAIITPPTEGE